ncbi:hypothetical protein RWK44_27185 [Rhizobium sp. 25PS6]|uniref:hypothetical protein n=1 Tax=Rhizobium TaxID=379 RepID=UPI001FE7B837|nr:MULTISPECIES: hypothetical protein [Rhizobium]MDU0364084.1 hypothetical protein [Rhizobium sp. 25PS6]
MPEQGNPEIARRRRVIGIWFWSLVLLSVATWVLIPRLPTQGVCYFRDTWFLKALWHQNITIYDQFINLRPSNSQQCVFFATRSMLSLYFATFACAIVIYSPKGKPPAPKAWIGIALITVFLIGHQIFFDGFGDGPRGYRAYDSINSLIFKSTIRMFLFYFFLTFWLLVALEWRRNRVRGNENESREPLPQGSDNATKPPFTHPLTSDPSDS